MSMDPLVLFLEQFRPTAHYLYSGQVCGLSPTRYAGNTGYLHILRAGNLVFVPDGPDASSPVSFEEPTILFCPSTSPHRLMGGEDNPAQMLCASMRFGDRPDGPFATLFPSYLAFPISRVKPAEHCLSLLFLEADKSTMGWQTAVDGLFEYLMTILIREAVTDHQLDPAILKTITDHRLTRALELIHGDLKRDWTVKSLAESCGMSRAGFARCFNDIVGMTPIAYLTEIRLARAQVILRRGVPQKRAAMDVGFSSAATFSRAFARRFGSSPGVWLEHSASQPAAQ